MTNKFEERISRNIRKISNRLMSRRFRRIHFLHLGKNAGTQILSIARQINSNSKSIRIVRYGHSVKLKSIPDNEEYFFSIRNPVSRFRSGFYSRKRKGQPRVFREWSKYDALAFHEFEHANDLAECLFEDGVAGRKALSAMKSIRHVANDQIDWFELHGYFFEVRPPVWIIRQEHFEEDFQEFSKRASLDVGYEITKDPVKSHSNDYSGVPELSRKAIANLERWYAQDFEFYKACQAWMESSGAR